jgi:hypothetical protein
MGGGMRTTSFGKIFEVSKTLDEDSESTPEYDESSANARRYRGHR